MGTRTRNLMLCRRYALALSCCDVKAAKESGMIC